jgi:hypothetical protein
MSQSWLIGVSAVIDTAAVVTLISMKLFEELGGSVQSDSKIMLRGHGDEPSEAFRVPKFEFQLEGKIFSWNVCVVVMRDDFILGLDFLTKYECRLDL